MNCHPRGRPAHVLGEDHSVFAVEHREEELAYSSSTSCGELLLVRYHCWSTGKTVRQYSTSISDKLTCNSRVASSLLQSQATMTRPILVQSGKLGARTEACSIPDIFNYTFVQHRVVKVGGESINTMIQAVTKGTQRLSAQAINHNENCDCATPRTNEYSSFRPQG